MDDELSGCDMTHAAAPQTFAVDAESVHAVVTLGVVVGQAVHVVDDGCWLLLRPHVHAVARVGFAHQQHRRVHAERRAVVLPGDVGTRRRKLDGSVGQLLRLPADTVAEHIAHCRPVGDGSLEADAVLPTEFEGQRAPLLIAQGRVAEVEAFGDSHFHRLALSREAKLVLQPERVVTCRCLQGNEQK